MLTKIISIMMNIPLSLGLTILLFLSSFFVLIYSILYGEYPEIDVLKTNIKKYLLPGTSALVFLILGKLLFLSILSGVIFAFLGWYLPLWVLLFLERIEKKRLRKISRAFLVNSSKMYGSNLLTDEVMKKCAQILPEPFATEFTNMEEMYRLRDWQYHKMLKEMGDKYGLKELQGAAQIIEASESAGGPKVVSIGLKELSRAFQKTEKRLSDRKKSNVEPNFACYLSIAILALGLFLDITIWKSLFLENTFKLSQGCLVFVALVFAKVKLTENKDLQL